MAVIRSTCSVFRAGGWNIWATDLPNYDRNPLPPNNREAVEASSPLFMMTCLLFRKSKYELQWHINTSKRSSKQSALREWFISGENHSRRPLLGNKLLALHLSSFNNLMFCCKCILDSNFSIVFQSISWSVFLSNERITFAARHQTPKQYLQRENSSLIRWRSKEN